MSRTVIPEGSETRPLVSTPNEDGGLDIGGSPSDDRLVGTGGSDNMAGLAGADLIASGAGPDVIVLGSGADTGVGGTGVDSIQGNRGDDSIDGGADDDSLRGGKDNDTIDSGEGDDFALGDSGDDIIFGRAGDDNAQGNRGIDVLSGGEDNDTLEGGKGPDSLDGGIGDDFLSGSRGNDILTGGTGADDFFFWFEQNGGYGVDTLTDFNPDEGDRIVLAANFPTPEDARFNALTGTPTGSPLPADLFAVIADFNAAVDGNSSANIIYDPNNGVVYYNPTTVPGDEEAFAKVDQNVFDANNPLENTDFEIL